MFAGLKVCITIHNNLLVYWGDENKHNRNMAAMFERAKVKGVTFKLAKSTICAAEVKWFGPVFSAAGVSADLDKIQHIVQAGRPKTIEDVQSLLQASVYNTKYGFNLLETKSYEEVTAPFRRLLIKDATYRWDKECKTSFRPC